MRVGAVHVVALLIGNHLQRQLVMISEKQRPLAVFRNRRCLPKDIDNGESVFHPERHEHAQHDRKVKCHVALIAIAEIGDGIFGPLIGFRQEHSISKVPINVLAKLL